VVVPELPDDEGRSRHGRTPARPRQPRLRTR
jgi:hypothetical protein